MKRTSMLLAVLALGVMFAGNLATSSAATCGSGAREATDRFGSCEESNGDVKCGSGTDVSTLATIIVKNDSGTQGVQGCSAQDDTLVISGRVGAYKDGNNNVTVFVDGSDSKNSGGASAWQRYDVRSGGQVCARRGTGGTYYTGANSGLGSSNPDSVNQGAPSACQ